MIELSTSSRHELLARASRASTAGNNRAMLHAKDVGPWRSPGSTYFEARQRRRARDPANADLADAVQRSECYEALLSLPQNRGSREQGAESFDGADGHEVQRATLPQPPGPDIRPVEELCWVGGVLVWSVGARIERTFDFGGENGDEILQALFAYFDAPSTVMSGSTAPQEVSNARFDFPGSLHSPQQRPSAELVKGICVFLREQVRIFYATGEEYVLHFGWTLKRAWAAHVGIICETVPPSGDDAARSGAFVRLWCLSDPASYQFRPLFASRKVVLPPRDTVAPTPTNPAASKEDSGSATLPVTPLEPRKSIIYCTDKSQGHHLPLVLFSIDGSADIHIGAYTRVTVPEDPTDAEHEAGGPAVVTAPPSPVYALRRSSRVSRKRSSASQSGAPPGRSRSSLPASNEHALGLSTAGGERYSPDDDVQMRRRTSAAMSRRASSRGMSISGLGAREEYLGLASAANADIVGRGTTHAEIDDNLSFAFDPANAPDLSEGELVVSTLKVLQIAEVTPV